MADGGDFDPCECINILNHEGRMQRLISMLRNSQSSCTDSECDGIGPLGNPGAANDTTMTMWTFMIGWILMAVVLYFMRPSRNEKPKNGNNGQGNGRGDGNGGRDLEPIF
jgi:hypothetical protein